MGPRCATLCLLFRVAEFQPLESVKLIRSVMNSIENREKLETLGAPLTLMLALRLLATGVGRERGPGERHEPDRAVLGFVHLVPGGRGAAAVEAIRAAPSSEASHVRRGSAT